MGVFAGIEAGGSKFICGIGSGPGDLISTRIPTTTPSATVAAVAEWIREHAVQQLTSVGIGAFGPLDLNPASPSFGHITSTPKAAWRNFDIAGEIRKALGVPVHVPVHIDTDVNAALLGESRWGAAQGLSDCVYLTIGTGIGGAALIAGRLLRGTGHAEMGHIRIPYDTPHDGKFSGVCPYHGDCLEGLASGPAIEARWGQPASELPADHPAWGFEARYLALALVNLTLTLAPERILMGGGVMRHPSLFQAIRRELKLLLAGYAKEPEIVPPGLGENAGVLGALALCSPEITGSRKI